jgi:hypothetical protein
MRTGKNLQFGDETIKYAYIYECRLFFTWAYQVPDPISLIHENLWLAKILA